jgi:hypothetical protein
MMWWNQKLSLLLLCCCYDVSTDTDTPSFLCLSNFSSLLWGWYGSQCIIICNNDVFIQLMHYQTSVCSLILISILIEILCSAGAAVKHSTLFQSWWSVINPLIISFALILYNWAMMMMPSKIYCLFLLPACFMVAGKGHILGFIYSRHLLPKPQGKYLLLLLSRIMMILILVTTMIPSSVEQRNIYCRQMPCCWTPDGNISHRMHEYHETTITARNSSKFAERKTRRWATEQEGKQ